MNRLHKRRYKWPRNRRKDAQTSLVVREMQIKTTVRYHFKPIRMAKIKKTKILIVGKYVA